MADTRKAESLPSLAEFFSPSGRLASASGFRFESRPGQYKMALFVENALVERHHLLVEAGTGTGKTMAYLYPALRYAIATGKRIIVSTGTKNLQEQLFYKDVPLLESIFGPMDICYLKGRSNYLCRQKLYDLQRYSLAPEEMHEHDLISVWETTTQTGDRAELAVLPEASSLWRRIDARGEACTGKKCPSYGNCFVSEARKKAAASHIIIVNHHLFFTDLVLQMKAPDAAILPAAHAVIFDEAHELEAVASDSFGLSVSNRRIAELVGAVGLSELIDRPVSSYSGGQRRRLEIARALVSAPRVLFLDEPTVGLDPRIRHELLDVIVGLRNREAMTIVGTTHYLDEAQRLCDQVAIIHQGEIVALDSPQALLAGLGREILEFRVAGSTEAAIAALRERGVARGDSFSIGARVTVPLHEHAATEALAVIDSERLHVSEITTRVPTLDDVYLQLTGARIDDAA